MLLGSEIQIPEAELILIEYCWLSIWTRIFSQKNPWRIFRMSPKHLIAEYEMLLVKLVFSARKEKRAELKKELRTRRASEIESRSIILHVCL